MIDTKLANILEELKSREPIFHHLKVETTRADVGSMLTAHDFWEVGTSGNRYNHILKRL